MQKWLYDHLLKLNAVETMNQPEGFNRPSYSKEEWKARGVFMKIAKELGLKVKEDAAGNVIARWEEESHPKESPAVATGSHLDTVAMGGGYDGVAGVLCGLGAVYQLKKESYIPSYPIEVICFVSEESSRFGVSTIGSKAMSGILDVENVAGVKDEQGITVKEAMAERELDIFEAKKAERSEHELLSFVELHIEQGMRIENAGADFGSVSAISCPIRFLISINGKAGHTGTTPMGERQDALVYAAELIQFIHHDAIRLNETNQASLVATASTIDAEPNAMNVIPGKITLGVDIRSVSDSLKEEMADAVRKKCSEMEDHFHTSIEIDTLVNNPSVPLEEEVRQELEKAGELSGLEGIILESGAGHDVMNMQKKWPSGLVFIPCRDGLSHHPDEHASLEDLENGVHLLAAYLRE